MCEKAENAKTLVGMAFNDFGTNTLRMRRKCKSERRLDGKVVVITGANSGIGKESALQLSKRGAKIYIGCRSLDKAQLAINDIKTVNPSADIIALKLDLASLKSIRQFACDLKEREPVIDILINNAGIMMCPESKTTEGFEMQFGSNYLGPFLLTLLLLPHLRQSTRARVINVSSSYHKVGKIHFDNIMLANGAYDPTDAYTQSKLAQVLATREMARRLGDDSTVMCYALNPGIVKTELQKYAFSNDIMRNMLFLTPEMGCQTTLYCTLEESLDNESGFYYDNCKREDSFVKHADNMDDAKMLWQLSCELVDIEESYRI
ncbi:retinol dehydrogenase 11-like [Oppia nitens]|uniref:retinol dehydrogenase 11-like n=1 Tax=Oppia nitens TaxID=1686743 RepID=UPI0023DC5489|nr:retinol dehydrogenase 11-like [Oppia nitens]